MNKLEIGLSITGFVFVIFLIMNYSSFEMHQGSRDAVPDEAVRTARWDALGNKRLIFYNVTTGVEPQTSWNTASQAIDTIHAAVGAHAGSHATRTANDIFNRDDTTTQGPRVVLNNYKNIIGPGMNTVLGMPKKGQRGQGIGTQKRPVNEPFNSRRSYGSHGILGDMYRYRSPEGWGSANASWETVGGWTGNQPRHYGSWLTNKGMSVGSHKNSGDANDKPWERVKLLTHEMPYVDH